MQKANFPAIWIPAVINSTQGAIGIELLSAIHGGREQCPLLSLMRQQSAAL
jgi:hypothetical protein